MALSFSRSAPTFPHRSLTKVSVCLIREVLTLLQEEKNNNSAIGLQDLDNKYLQKMS